jgi:hypothetical protein
MVVPYKSKIVSAIGAISKPESNKVRLIHDGSKPDQGSLNSFAEIKDRMSYETIQTAIDFLREGYFMAKLELKSVKIHPDDYPFTGLKWRFTQASHYTYMVDAHLPFGCRRSPMHFYNLTKAIKSVKPYQCQYRNFKVIIRPVFLVRGVKNILAEKL